MGGARAATILLQRQRSSISEAPSTTLRVVPLPRFAGADNMHSRSRDAHRARVLPSHCTKALPNASRQKKGGGAPIGALSWSRATPTNVAIRSRFGRGSGLSGDRSPFGAPPRRSPGRTHPASAQLQFPRFLRPGALGVTRCNLSRVYRAPRRPVVVPVERWPRAARGRFAKPPAGTALAPPSRSHPECALRRASFDSLSCSRNSDECQDMSPSERQ